MDDNTRSEAHRRGLVSDLDRLIRVWEDFSAREDARFDRYLQVVEMQEQWDREHAHQEDSDETP